jgi:lipoprotein-releasing system permease protein
VYVAVDVAQEFAGLGAAVTGIEIKAADRFQAPDLAAKLQDKLGYPYRVQDWEEQNAQLFQALKLEKLGMRFILLLIMLVAAFNVVSTLTMVVKDKTREIGILKAMGMRGAVVRRVFLLQGIVIGAAGTLLGAALGIAGGLLIDRAKLIALDPQVYFIDHLPVRITPFDVSWIILASVAIAVVATVYPAIQAARLYPLEAIRHE